MFLYVLLGFLLGVVCTIIFLCAAVYFLWLRKVEQQQSPVHQTHWKHAIPSLPHAMKPEIETCLWLNAVMTRVCSQALSSQQWMEACHDKLHEMLNNQEEKSDLLGDILITEINIGSRLPHINGIKLITAASADEMHALVDISYKGEASFVIQSEFWLNWPQKRFACLPFSLHVSLENFSGKLAFMHPSGTKPCTLFFLKTPEYTLKIGSIIGHNTKLVNAAKVSKVIQHMVKKLINQELVAPNGLCFSLHNGKLENFGTIKQFSSLPTEKKERNSPYVNNRPLVPDLNCRNNVFVYQES